VLPLYCALPRVDTLADFVVFLHILCSYLFSCQHCHSVSVEGRVFSCQHCHSMYRVVCSLVSTATLCIGSSVQLSALPLCIGSSVQLSALPLNLCIGPSVQLSALPFILCLGSSVQLSALPLSLCIGLCVQLSVLPLILCIGSSVQSSALPLSLCTISVVHAVKVRGKWRRCMRMNGSPHAPLPSLNPRLCNHLVGGCVNPDFADEIISCPSWQSNQDSFVVPPVP
jgi:hypothetical protein